MISHALIRVSNTTAAMTVTDPASPQWSGGAKVWYGTLFTSQTITAVDLVDTVGGAVVAVATYHVVGDTSISLDDLPMDVVWGDHYNLRVTSTESGAVTSTGTVWIIGF